MTGTLIAVEGIDGSGTTTLVESFADEPDTVTTKEPAEQHWTGRVARRAINDNTTHPMTDLFFFLGDRAYHLENTVWPALADGQTVITDRYLHSTFAYQQENIKDEVYDPVDFIDRVMLDWVERPDLVILLDLPTEVAAERRSEEGDKYEVSEFQRKVRDNYLRVATNDPDIYVIDAEQTIEEVRAEADQLIEAYT